MGHFSGGRLLSSGKVGDGGVGLLPLSPLLYEYHWETARARMQEYLHHPETLDLLLCLEDDLFMSPTMISQVV